MSLTAAKTLLHEFQTNVVQPPQEGAREFFRVRLTRDAAERLASAMRELAATAKREWYFLTWSSPDLSRLRLTHFDRTPGFESNAAPDYLRNEAYRVTGKTDSCNINFSGTVGAPLIAARIEAVLQRAHESIEIAVCVISKKRKSYLLEFFADTDIACRESAEHERLGATGESLAGETWPSEDFSDWEAGGE